MAITNLALPAFLGKFEGYTGFPDRPAVQTVEVASNLFFNLVEQRDPNYAFVYLTDQNPTTLVHTANTATHVVGQNASVEATRLFKISATKVLAILGVNQDSTIRYRVFTFDAASKLVTAYSEIKTIVINPTTYEGFIAMGNRADFLQPNPTTLIMTAGMYTAWLLKLTIDASAETMTAGVPELVGHMTNSLHWQWMPGRNKWRLSGYGFTATPAQDVAGHSHSNFTYLVNPAGDISKVAISGAMVGADSGYFYQFENGDQVGFSTNGRMVFTRDATTGVIRQLQVHNYNATTAFANSATSFSATAAHKFIHAIDDHHFVFGYVVYNSSQPFRSARSLDVKPTAVVLRYVEKVNDDIYIVSSNSLGATGVSFSLPTTITNDTFAYYGFLPGTGGFVVNEDFTFTLNYQSGARLQSVRAA